MTSRPWADLADLERGASADLVRARCAARSLVVAGSTAYLEEIDGTLVVSLPPRRYRNREPPHFVRRFLLGAAGVGQGLASGWASPSTTAEESALHVVVREARALLDPERDADAPQSTEAVAAFVEHVFEDADIRASFRPERCPYAEPGSNTDHFLHPSHRFEPFGTALDQPHPYTTEEAPVPLWHDVPDEPTTAEHAAAREEAARRLGHKG